MEPPFERARTEAERHSPKENRLLAALPAEDYEQLLLHGSLVPLPLGTVLYEAGSQMRHVYFPVSGLLSLLYTLDYRGSAELAIVGNDGCLGVVILLGGDTTASRAIVQIAGYAYAVESAIVLKSSTVPARCRACCCAMSRRG